MIPAPELDALRATPGGAALADAYLTLRRELGTLISYAQQVESGAGMNVQALREHAESLLPLLDEPHGKRWTAEYWEAQRAVDETLAPLTRYLADRDRGYRHDFVLEDLAVQLRRVARSGGEP